MNIHIAPHRLLSEIQTDFNQAFPFLKLEFFDKEAILNSDYSSGRRVLSDRNVGDIQLEITEGELEFDGKTKVSEIEKDLKENYSLAAQVFRKSGNLWLETTKSDSWSLSQQNEHGRELSTVPVAKPDVESYDLNRDSDH